MKAAMQIASNTIWPDTMIMVAKSAGQPSALIAHSTNQTHQPFNHVNKVCIYRFPC
jgi:hypothetical protein